MRAIHYLAGGGLGDVFREATYHNAIGILRRWKNENPTAWLKVFLMSHNPSSQDLLKGQPWIDEVVQRPFPLERTWAWEDAYSLYPKEFADYKELRFNLAERRSLYASQFNAHRPRHTPAQVQYIEPVGCLWEPALLTDGEQEEVRNFGGRIVLHPSAGETERSLPVAMVRVLQARTNALLIGGNYVRRGHAEEFGNQYSPRVLYHGLRRAKAVIGTESSVWYLATMLGIPSALLYQPRQTYDNVLRGLSSWNWFFGANDPKNIAIDLSLKSNQPLDTWIDNIR